MNAENVEILRENSRLRGEVADLKLEVNDLLAKLRFLAGQRFATSQSEKMAPHQRPLFTEGEQPLPSQPMEEEKLTVAAHDRKRKKRKSLPEHLPRVVINHELSGAERLCPHGHGPMEKAGEAISEQLEYEPARFRVLEHHCETYGCLVCDAKVSASHSHPTPLPGSLATPSLLAHVVGSKYCDHLPLYRQEKMLARHGVFLSRTTLANWIIKIAERLLPLVNLLREEIVAGNIVQMDETRLQVLNLPGKSPTSHSYIWVMAGGRENHQAVVFSFDPSRAGRVAEDLLTDFSGYLQVDGYDGYNAVCRRDEVTRVGCLMHIRRPFHIAHQQLKTVGGGEIAKEALSHIRELYDIEAEAKADPTVGRLAMNADERKNLREIKSRPVLQKLRNLVDNSIDLVRPKSPTGEALSYCINEWPNFVRFLEDGHLEIDNGRAERAIRPFAQGRRNWLFADSEAGAHASATMFTLIETAKLHGHNPLRYLEHVFAKIDGAKTLADLEQMLPWNIPPPS